MTDLKITMMPTADLTPNPWNPNRLTSAERAELLAEVKRMGAIPKPIVARLNCDGHQIIDGEQSWDVATELGLDEVPVEIVEADDFEAMLQTLKRNSHGTHDRVHEGRMFLAMKKARGLSLRAMEKAVGKSQGYVRDSIAYANLAALRSTSAPDVADAEITKLRVSQIRELGSLPVVLAVECMRNDFDIPYFPDSEWPDLDKLYKYADKIGLLKFVTGAEDLDDTLYTILHHTGDVRVSGQELLAPLAAVLMKREMCYPLSWILIGDDGPAVTPGALDVAITEAKKPRAADEILKRTKKKARRRRAFSPRFRLREIAQRDNWLVPEERDDWVDPGDDTPSAAAAPTPEELAEREALRQQLKDAPDYITGIGWPLEEQVALFEIVSEALALGVTAEEVEAMALAAVEEHKGTHPTNYRWCGPSKTMAEPLEPLRQRHAFTHPDAMIDCFFDWLGDEDVHDPDALRRLLEAAPRALLLTIAGSVGTWPPSVWLPYVREALGGEPVGEADTKLAQALELDRQIGAAGSAA